MSYSTFVLALKTVRQGNRNKRLSSNTEFRTELYDTNKKKSEFSLIAQFFALSTSKIHIIDTYLQIIKKRFMKKYFSLFLSVGVQWCQPKSAHMFFVSRATVQRLMVKGDLVEIIFAEKKTIYAITTSHNLSFSMMMNILSMSIAQSVIMQKI